MNEKIKPKRNIWLDRLHKQMERPGQGPAQGPYWIVLNLSVHKNLNYQPPSFPYRHPTLEAATEEAGRLAANPHMAGWRFGVFHFTGVTAKVDRPQTEIEAEKAE